MGNAKTQVNAVDDGHAYRARLRRSWTFDPALVNECDAPCARCGNRIAPPYIAVTLVDGLRLHRTCAIQNLRGGALDADTLIVLPLGALD